MSTTDALLAALLAVELLKLMYATETGRRLARKLGSALPDWRARRARRRMQERQEQEP